MKLRPSVLGVCGVASILAIASSAHAQTAPGFSTQRFQPSERGSEFFALDTLDMRGDLRPAVGVVGEYGGQPFVLFNRDGSQRAAVVDKQIFLHAGASLVLFERLRVGINVPFAVMNDGTSGQSLGGFTYAAPQHLALGDIRYSADLRLFGTFGDPFTMAIGGQGFIPTGEAKQYTGEDAAHGQVHMMMSGELGVIIWALKAGVHIREPHNAYNVIYGDEIIYGAALGLRVADRKLVIGPEVYGATGAKGSTFFAESHTPVEAILGAHYTIGSDWRIGAGAGPGLTHDLGSPHLRVLGSIEWTPHYEPKKVVGDRDGDGVLDDVDACPDRAGIKTSNPATNGCPLAVPVDRDGDGIVDGEDACPDKPGPRTNDPKTNGCPVVAPADRDGDGIIDGEDACPDQPGVKTSDPKTNGCPPPKDTDGDGITDDVDACPDKPGVKTDDPKTNGCPPNPDRDADGIPNDDDACPDAAGPKDPDPKKNGCPKAAVVGGQIKILEQVKFATGSAVILKDSDAILNAVVTVLKDHPEIKHVRVEGHTDNQGPAGYNKVLSTQRAASVVKWLTSHGIDKDRLSSQGFGMEKPIDDNKTEAGRKNNRRVEFHIEDTK